MYIIWGIISTALAVFLEFILQLIPYSIHNKSLAFIIPIGGFVEGALCALGIYLYLKMKSLHAKPKHFVCGAFIAFLGFWAVYYMGYQTSYIYKDTINHSFHGEKLTKYIFNDGDSFTFSDYLSLVIKNIRFKSFAYLGSTAVIDNFGSSFNSFVFISECIGFCLGGLGSGTIALNNRESCRQCRTSFNYKKLYAFKAEAIKAEMNDVQRAFSNKEDFKAFVYKSREELKNYESYFEAFFKYCDTCNLGYIEYRYMKCKNKLNDEVIWVEDKEKYMEIPIPSDKFEIVNKTSI